MVDCWRDKFVFDAPRECAFDPVEELVAQAQRAISGVQPQQLRDSTALRQQVAAHMAAVQATVDGLMVDRPRRSIIRPQRPEGS